MPIKRIIAALKGLTKSKVKLKPRNAKPVAKRKPASKKAVKKPTVRKAKPTPKRKPAAKKVVKKKPVARKKR